MSAIAFTIQTFVVYTGNWDIFSLSYVISISDDVSGRRVQTMHDFETHDAFFVFVRSGHRYSNRRILRCVPLTALLSG